MAAASLRAVLSKLHIYAALKEKILYLTPAEAH